MGRFPLLANPSPSLKESGPLPPRLSHPGAELREFPNATYSVARVGRLSRRPIRHPHAPTLQIQAPPQYQGPIFGAAIQEGGVVAFSPHRPERRR